MKGSPEFFVGWGTLTLINAGLAQGKGHSGLIWWLISLFIGPIATFIIVAFLKPTDRSTEINRGEYLMELGHK